MIGISGMERGTADFDHFELHNFNRQVGANVGSIGRPKMDVMSEMALGINPELEIKRFEKGIDASNAEAFLDGADVSDALRQAPLSGVDAASGPISAAGRSCRCR